MLRPSRPQRVNLHDAVRQLPSARLGGLSSLAQADGIGLAGITLNSADVRPGELFAALPGAKTHGAAHAAAALRAGAAAVLTDPAGEALLPPAAPRLVVADPRAELGPLAAWLYGYPARALKLIGVTGTNGKTTVAHLLESALAERFGKVALLGTIISRIDGEELASERTTLEAPALQAAFAAMIERGVEACVMEVSSHALALHRVDGVVFEVAVFTNLTRDHLDFHANMEDYFAAKAGLFAPGRAGLGVIGLADAWGRRLAGETAIPRLTVSRDPADLPDWLVIPGRPGRPGTPFRLVRRPAAPPAAAPGAVAGEVSGGAAVGKAAGEVPGAGGGGAAGAAPGEVSGGAAVGAVAGAVPGAGAGQTPGQTPGQVRAAIGLPGQYNVDNAALALVAAMAAGVPAEAAARGIEAAPAVPGRMERVPGPPGSPQVVVDYAHAPASVAAALAALRPHTPGRLIAVLGAGGDRDHGKREAMGRAAAAGADLVYVTDDNPRSEPPAAIRAAVLAGAGPEAREVACRADGIGQAIAVAVEQDTVVILGKGHEAVIDYGGQLRPHQDRLAAGAALRARMEGAA
ncbi:MAG: UDP-N-acetylmuramoyl-L-alanyl-D-glutamate--2,6-diaminopimelate ligase [Bifidobacteriaceae bacterium]|jgi:UDP-N-acetylmuramoyl-L-alanyl-D-glutamate--2,6-diaminopimelate ligase|nr:UDP-N-acetylmuramoyl-L-alanyl-D-glutamate--2,6-diaminopimelate ligase [Bifidobacteriaceae bacterium]